MPGKSDPDGYSNCDPDPQCSAQGDTKTSAQSTPAPDTYMNEKCGKSHKLAEGKGSLPISVHRLNFASRFVAYVL